MIFASLRGGLGNQMFQYACARRLAHVLKAPLKLDLSACETCRLRPYALDGLSISAEIAAAGEVMAFRRRARDRSHLPHWVFRAVPGWRCEVFQERSFAFDPDVLELCGSILLEGYWQCERYFSDIADSIRSEFRVKVPMDQASTSLAAKIGGTSAVSIHVRRGDYVSDPEIRRVHGSCGLDYYQRAIEEIARIEPRPHLFVFSDDVDWAKENLRARFPTVVVEHAGAEGHLQDLRLMSLCRHHIIANSSFSWWGAWLNPDPDKRVIAPRKWFNVQTHDTRNLLPPDWVTT